ncbi:MAG: hypothetical protein WDA20_13335 [Desulfuromonadales bacterium]
MEHIEGFADMAQSHGNGRIFHFFDNFADLFDFGRQSHASSFGALGERIECYAKRRNHTLKAKRALSIGPGAEKGRPAVSPEFRGKEEAFSRLCYQDC